MKNNHYSNNLIIYPNFEKLKVEVEKLRVELSYWYCKELAYENGDINGLKIIEAMVRKVSQWVRCNIILIE